MKIGILTFHWATNYGAVLQCYALQTYLESLGHKVNVINYKPSFFDEDASKTVYRSGSETLGKRLLDLGIVKLNNP